ncbi:MAG: hypothetical protein MSA90_05215 [Faecalicatena sp.]|uniref:hypothetical protein n=1 Tax=Faecalicatena sp. TaxID=2005360 RepID=UPI00258F0A26|nr:hypothetical protein [Faecalicatena sp.]MCI6464847.1 hypothetical protein [Faecalicatena sp.]MDY5619951.1 hypothetical protein [Lachnospiraceae bacterium]
MRKQSRNRQRMRIAASLIMSAVLGSTVLGAGSADVMAKEKGKNVQAPQVSKEEVVYSSLDNQGKVKEIYVVNAFNLPRSGEISDYGEYSLLENLTDTGALTYEDGRVSAQAEKGRFYYQGNMVSKELPWNIQIDYTLDGKPIGAKQLAGASGKVGLTVLTTKNPKMDPIFYQKYMLQVTITLDTSICENIVAKDATLANAGSDKQVTFTVMPEKEGRLEVKTDASDFTMKGISIAAVPFSAGTDMLDVKQIDQLTDGLNQLSSGISQLNGGAQQLKGGAQALQNGTDELKNGVSEFQNGIAQLKEGADGISSGASLLSSGSGEFQSGLNQAAAAADEVLNGSGKIDQVLQFLKAGTEDLGSLDLGQLIALPKGLNDLADGLEGIQGGFAQIFQTLDDTMSTNPVTDLTKEELGQIQQAMGTTSPEAQAAFGKLMGNYQSAMTFLKTYQAVSGNLDELVNGLGTMIENIREISTRLEMLQNMDPDSLKGLADGIRSLADEYESFHQGLKDYMEGIQEMSDKYTEIDDGIRGLAEGTAGISNGIGKSADGAASLLDGAGSLDGGAAQLSNGVSQLADGLGTLNKETQKMPDEMKKRIDEMMDKYTNQDFVPISFTSSKNQNVVSVQFVLSTDEIKKEEVKSEKTEEKTKEGVWEKLMDLF